MDVGPHCAVVAILQANYASAVITTVTKQGVVVQWDMNKLSTQSFSIKATPASLRRIAIADMSPVVGATLLHKGHQYMMPIDNRRSSVVSAKEERLCFTLSNGSVTVYDMDDERMLEDIACPRLVNPLSQEECTVAAPGVTDGNVVAELPPVLLCPIAFSAATGNQIFYSGSPRSNHMIVRRLGGSTASLRELPRDHAYRQQLKILQQQHLRYADAVSYLEHLRPATLTGRTRGKSDYDSYISQQMATMCLSCKPTMQRTSRICHTLGGYVLEAVPGSNRIVTTHDLSFYLCATGQENRSGSAVADSTDLTKSVSISGMLNGNKSSVIHLRGLSGADDKMCYTVDAIYGCEISLDKPYHGPPITGGLPKHTVCTNLRVKPPPPIPRGRLTAVLTGVKSTHAEADGKCGEHIANVPLPARATAIQAHPSCPYVVVGCLDDSVVIISAEESISSMS